MIRTVSTLLIMRPTCAIALLGVAFVLTGCASSGSGNAMKEAVQTVAETQREVDRTFRAPFNPKEPVDLQQRPGKLGPAAKPVDTALIKTAIERHAEARKQKAGTYVVAGANLTPDGKLRAIVLFTSENWCQPQGCEMAIFEQGNFGWKSVATVSRVRPPIRVTSKVTAGWHDIWAVTGREETGKNKKSFIQNVHLPYGSNGYPSTTTFAISATKGEPEGQVIIEDADLDVPDKARFATGGRDPDSTRKKKSSLINPAAAPTPK